MSNVPIRVVAVVLGDSHSGKTALIKAISSAELCDPSKPFSPTVGAECYSSLVTYHGRAVELVLWDYGGSERFAPPLGASTVHADVCCLVADLTDRQSLQRLNQWRDEFAQSFAAFAAPAFVLVGSKADVADSGEGRRGVSRTDLEAFAALEATATDDSDSTWPRQAAGTATVVPPVFEVSSASAVSLGTSIAELKEQLIFRGLVQQAAAIVLQDRLDEVIGGSIGPKQAYETLLKEIKQGAVTLALHGAVAAPAAIFGNVAAEGVVAVPKQSLRPWDVVVWSTSYPGMVSTPGLYRLMRAVVLMIDVSDTINVNSVRLLKEDYCARAKLRDASSIVWIVLGVCGPHKTQQAAQLLSSHCWKEGLAYVEVSWFTSDDLTAEAWSSISRIVQEEYVKIVMRRADDQLNVAATNCPNGACSWVGRAIDVEQHLTTCPKQIVQCRWDQCQHLSFRDQRETHEKFCVNRPATCHFCEQPYGGTLVEHLVLCVKREEFERTHIPCPMADYGCNTTHILRGDLPNHLSQEIVPHVELLCTATTHLRKLLLEQERRHGQAMEAMHKQHLEAVQALTLRLEDTQAVVKRQHDAIVEANLEFKLVWEELQGLKSRGSLQ